MPIIAVVIGFAALVWGAIYARRGSLVVGFGALVLVSYVLGHQFWHAKFGPLPVTLDRALLVGLFAAFAVQWRLGRLSRRAFTASDWTLAAVLLLFATSTILSGQPGVTEDATSKWGRLITSFVIPAMLFVALRQVQFTRRDLTRVLSCFVALGVYLATTALFEVSGHWSLVFPRYIANPALGIHFGRARGPDLNAVSLGLYLTVCIWCAWTLLTSVQRRWQQLVLLGTLPLMAAGVFVTYTRSTWIGLAASAMIVAAIEIPRRWRLHAISMSALAGLLVLAMSWTHLIGLEREGSAADAEHSVDQRKSFAYVSWQMFRDHPVTGVGFGRFYDRKLAYLSDRSQDFELDSIRPLDHHNTLLSVLTETGLVGLAAFVALLAAWARNALWLSHNGDSPRWVRVQGTLMLALVANYLCSAFFHDLTLLPSQHVLLFVFAALTVNLRQPSAWFGIQASSTTCWHTLKLFARRCRNVLGTPAKTSGGAAHVNLFGMQIARITMDESVERVLGWCQESRGEACRYVVTPNVDHAVLYQRRSDLRAAYSNASLVLADGAPIVLASRLLGRTLPERVAGSDLVPRIFQQAETPLKVFLLGAAPGIAETAAARIRVQWRRVKVVGSYSPPVGFENDDAENARILTAVAAAAPDLVVVGFGAPKQELWVHRHRGQLQAKVVLCAGATIDFLAGHRRRSPVWMRRVGLEWLHRVCSEPRRLATRYARDAWIFPQLVWQEWRRLSA